MKLPLDQITRKKLVIAKQLYQRAVLDSRGQLSPTDRIISVIEFDLALETMLKIILNALDASKAAREFPELLKHINTLLLTAKLERLPDQEHLKYVHKIRNDAQHQARYPNESEVNDCRTYTRDFLNTVVPQIWDISFESVNLADLIDDAEVKKLMLVAYEQYDKQNYSASVDLASEAMDRGLRYVEQAIVGRFPEYIKGIAVTDHVDAVQKEVESHELIRNARVESHHQEEIELLAAVMKMRETMIYLALEMNISQSVRYKQIVGTTFFTQDEKHHRVNNAETLDQAAAEFVLSFCTDSIVRMESHVGSLQKPFGIDWFLAAYQL